MQGICHDDSTSIEALQAFDEDAMGRWKSKFVEVYDEDTKSSTFDEDSVYQERSGVFIFGGHMRSISQS